LKGPIKSILIKSILSGALFFLSHSAYAFDDISNMDSLTPDTAILHMQFTDSLITGVDTNLIYTEKDSLLSDPLEAEADYIMEDTTLSRKSKKEFMPSPQRATILSAVLPGLGQIYNRRYWKVPIIYAAGAGLLYYANEFDKQYNEAQDLLYQLEQDETVTADDQEYRSAENERYISRKRRTSFYIYTGILYLANVIDAMTDAYFLRYDISDQLDVSLEPSLQPELFQGSSSGMNYGFTLCLHF